MATSADEKNVKVGVQDFGIGISPEMQHKVFDRFFWVNDKSSTYPGLGLSVYISAQLMKKHGGNMDVQSEKGKGSFFVFTIPVSDHA